MAGPTPGRFPRVLLFTFWCGRVGWEWSERIALQGVCPRLCVVFLQGVSWSTTAVQEKEKTLQRMKRKKNVIKHFQNINNSV